MLSKIADAAAPILVVMTLLVAPSRGYSEETPRSPSRPWPIWNWQNHQPRQDQLKAAHTDDLTAQDARKVDQLYWQLEGRSPSGTDNCDANAIPPRERDKCRAENGARILPSRPVPTIMAPPR
jgi:hypothetical protein